jgi:hypothetical protein
MELVSAPLREEGAGARVRRLFPSPALHWPATDPFLLLDEFFVEAHAGFPDHPHRGFEIVTYMLDGGFEHRDSLGNAVEAPAGHAMHFVTGSGVIHSEMPLGTAHGLQLWINLRRQHKAIAPSLHLVAPDAIPVRTFDGGMIRRIASPDGPIALHTPVIYDDVHFTGEGTATWKIPSDSTALVYVVEGEPIVGGMTARSGQLCLYDGGDTVELGSAAPARAIVLIGERHHESVRFFGPFVD